MHKKQTWIAHLLPWRKGAIGQLNNAQLFLVVELDKDKGRHVRIEIPVQHVPALIADLQAVAERITSQVTGNATDPVMANAIQILQTTLGAKVIT